MLSSHLLPFWPLQLAPLRLGPSDSSRDVVCGIEQWKQGHTSVLLPPEGMHGTLYMLVLLADVNSSARLKAAASR